MSSGPSRPGRLAHDDHGRDRGIVMQVGPAPPAPTSPPEAPSVDPDHAGRRSWRRTGRGAAVLVAVVLAGVVGAVLLEGRSASPTVRTPVAGSGASELEPAPPAPAGVVTRRWSVLLSDTDVATGVAIVDDVVVAMLEPPFPGARGDDGRPDERVVVVGHDRTDGSRRWVRRFRAHTVVVVGPPGERTMLPTVGSRTWNQGREQWEARHVVALDAADGTVRWRRERLGPSPATSTVLRPANDQLDVRTDERFRVLDLDDGVVRQRFGVRPEPDWRAPTRVGARWLVPTRDGWDLVGPRGRREVVDTPSSLVQQVGDRVVVADGRRVVARDLATGRTAWAREFDHVVQWLALVDEHVQLPWTGGVRFPPDRDRPRGGVLVVTARTTDGTTLDGDEAWTETLLAPDGRVLRTRPSPDAESFAVVVDLELDDAWWSMCVRGEPARGATDRGPCPAGVALADPTGTVTGTVDLAPARGQRVGAGWPDWPRVTRTGLLVPDGDRVALRRWPDLSPAWSVPIGPGGRWVSTDQPLVDTDARGVAAVVQGERTRLAWHE